MSTSWQQLKDPKPKKPIVTADPDTLLGALQQVAENTTPIQRPLQHQTGLTEYPQMGWPIFMPQGASLEIDTYSSIKPDPGETVEFTWMDLTGRINSSPASTLINANTNRTHVINNFPLPTGWLLGVLVNFNTAGVHIKRGQYYVAGYLTNISNLPSTITLFADYVTSAKDVSWPGGRTLDSIEGPGYIYNVAPANPSAGANYSVVVPTGARWRIRGLLFSLVTDAVVGNRQLYVQFQDAAGNIFAESASFPIETNSSTKFYALQPGYPLVDSAFDGLSGGAHQPLPEDLVLPAGFKIVTATAAFDVGDQYQGMSLIVEEWLEP